MILEGKTPEFKVDLKIFSEGKDISDEFFEEFIISRIGDVAVVENSVDCLMKGMRFINRLKEFSMLEPSENDYMLVNNKKFACITKDTKEKTN